MSAEIIVVGSGVVGLSSAMALRQAGCVPLVVDGGELGDEAVWSLPPWELPAGIGELIERNDQRLPELVTELGQATGVDCEIHRTSLLIVGEPAAAGRTWLDTHPDLIRRGQVASFEPALSGADRQATLIETRSRVRSSRLARALGLALPQWQVEILSGRPVARLDVSGNIVLGVELADGGRISAEAVVMAAGANANRLLFDSGLEPLQLDPAEAPYLLFNPGQRLIGNIINTGDCCLAPLNDGRILAVDFSTAREASQAALDDLMQRVGNWLPALSRFDLQASGFGPSPGLGNGLPAIGAYPQVRGLWINGGHLRSGLGVGLAAAEMLAEQMTGGSVMADYLPRLRSAATAT
jgi:glycine oxidase